MNKNRSILLTYGLVGFLFGACFPIGAYLLVSLLNGINLLQIGKLHQANALLYMIDSAPVILMFFALAGGYFRAKAYTSNQSLTKLVTDLKSAQIENETAHLHQEKLAANLATILLEAHRTTSTIDSQFTSIQQSITDFSSVEKAIYQTIQGLRKSYSDSATINHELSENGSMVKNTNEVFANELNYSSTYIEDHIQLIGSVYDQIASYQSAIDSLSKSVTTLDPVVTAIQNINKKINILSINASIEAERAGELGRGFKIVAQEVKQLSALSDTAIKDVSTVTLSIKKITMDMHAAMGTLILAITEDSKKLQEIHSILVALHNSSENQSVNLDKMLGIISHMVNWFESSNQTTETITTLTHSSHDILDSINTHLHHISNQVNVLNAIVAQN